MRNIKILIIVSSLVFPIGISLADGLEDKLKDAVSEDNVVAVKDLLNKGVTVKTINSTSVLQEAAANSNYEIVEALVAAGADVNGRNENGRTALFEAASANEVKAVKLLLSKGADPNIKDNEGLNALNAASQESMVEIQNIHPAYLADQEEILNDLIVAGADVNIPILPIGRTPLMHAAEMGFTRIVRALIYRGAGIKAKDDRGKTALEGYSKNDQVRKVLLEAENQCNSFLAVADDAKSGFSNAPNKPSFQIFEGAFFREVRCYKHKLTRTQDLRNSEFAYVCSYGNSPDDFQDAALQSTGKKLTKFGAKELVAQISSCINVNPGMQHESQVGDVSKVWWNFKTPGGLPITVFGNYQNTFWEVRLLLGNDG